MIVMPFPSSPAPLPAPAHRGGARPRPRRASSSPCETSGCSAQRRGRNRRGCCQSPPVAPVHTRTVRSRAQAQYRPTGEPAMSPRHNTTPSTSATRPAGELALSRWDTLSGHRIWPRLGSAASQNSSLSISAGGRQHSMLAVAVGAAPTSPFCETTKTWLWRPSAPY
jgi:hypothetical protein